MNRYVGLGVAVLAIAAAATGGYVWVAHDVRTDVRNAARHLRAELGPSGSLSYTLSAVEPLRNTVVLRQVALRTASGTLLTASRVSVSGASGRISALNAADVRVSGAAAQGAVSAASLIATNVALPVPLPGQRFSIDPAAWSADAVSLRGVVLSAPGAALKLAAIKVTNYGAGRASALVARGFSAPVSNAPRLDRISFAALRLSGLDLATALNAIEHHTAPPVLSSGPVALSVTDFHADGARARVISVGKFTLSGTPGPDAASSHSVLNVTGVVIHPTDPAAAARLEELGLHALRGSLSATGSYRLAGGIAATRQTLRVDGLGQLGYDIRIAHLALPRLQPGTLPLPALLAAVRNAVVVSADIHLTDAGLLDRAFAIGARDTGTPPAALRARLAGGLAGNPVLGALPDAAQIKAALTSFALYGGTLRVAVHPAAPVGLFSLAGQSDPAAVFARLGVSVSAVPPAPPRPVTHE